MATPLHGKDGAAKVGGSTIALVDSWTADLDVSKDDVTAMDSGGWGMLLPGLKRVTGSISVRYATDDTAGQTVMRNSVWGGSAVVLSLYVSGTAKYLTGTAYLNESYDASHDAVAATSFDFESHGPWSYT